MAAESSPYRDGDALLLPGGVGVSQLEVYDWPTADDSHGGSPHMHLTCTEAYVVVAGTGAVQTLTASGAQESELRAGTTLWFTPGTIHRLINRDGLRIVVVMQNNGLPEAGDAVFTFPTEILDDPAAYAEAATLPDPAVAGQAAAEAAARARRDLAIEGFGALRAESAAGNEDALRRFHQQALTLVGDKLAGWRERWQAGALAEAERTGEQLTALQAGDVSRLAAAEIRRIVPGEDRRLGMCGRLTTYPIERAAEVRPE
ncbi:cupin domain-containing protein [Actinoalloteichus hymeniacidonis]|uniref:Mannose-6-phosphate isomerase n=1 Tax=Actinoalloteichus hymeniacidonis TaxID=340345 RepID=A0AAC9MZH2_9PSEU|nr:cupin domain-containing protein [Actinoalloteichus hymeniacidonis]AOS64469.1 mannose-6-phosphate isomerase [Actinoalloteichus hymeniacidonis]MBB5907461.1 mannose-6-phosphate isomerase-like protein (cupin superfamily) [Actinoalloteichus hymeniacidonis]